MAAERCKRVREHGRAVPGWPIWQLRPWLASYIGLVIAVYVAAIAVAVVVAPWSGLWHDLGLFGALLLCSALTVELTKRAGENAGVIKDVYGVWELPLAILLPPFFVLVAPIFRFTLTQLRIRPVPLHRRVFSAAVMGLSNASASLVFHAITGERIGIAPGIASPATLWLVAVAGAAMALWTVNTSLMLPAFKGSDPTVTLREILARDSVQRREE